MSNVKIVWRGDEFTKRLAEAVDIGITAASERLAQQVRSNIKGGHGGVASEAGSSPNSQSGNLKNSWSVVPAKNRKGHVGSDLNYARFLERGAMINRARKPITIPLNSQMKRMMRAFARARDAISTLLGPKPARRTTKQGLILGKEKGKGKTASFEAFVLITRKTINLKPRPYAQLAISQLASNKSGQKAFVAAASRYMKGAAK